MKEFRVLITGSHTHVDHDLVYSTLDQLGGKSFGDISNPSWLPRPDLVIIHGDAKCVDRAADEWAVTNWVTVRPYPADWGKYGNRAGSIRNQQMLDEEKPDLVIAFPGGPGTADMIRRARKAKIAVEEIIGR